MADKPISQLDVKTTDLATGDFFIVNEGNATTKRVDYSKLQQTVGGTFDPIIHDFVIDAGRCNTTAAGGNHSVESGGKFVNIRYPLASGFPGGVGGNLTDIMACTLKPVTMPAGANKAIVLFQGSVEYGINPSVTDGTGKFHIITAHRLGITGATLPIPNANLVDKTGFGCQQACYFSFNNESSTPLGERMYKYFFMKSDIISFADGATVTFDSNVDGIKLGRARLKLNSSRMVILPFNASDDILSYDLGLDYDFRYANVSELPALYQDYIPTPEGDAADEGSDYRSNLRRALLALESRRNYKIASGAATDAEYESLIHAIWDTLDDTTLTSSEATQQRVRALLSEATLPKYGIAGVFQFEKDLGISPTII